jgi:hypothetical protein
MFSIQGQLKKFNGPATWRPGFVHLHYNTCLEYRRRMIMAGALRFERKLYDLQPPHDPALATW